MYKICCAAMDRSWQHRQHGWSTVLRKKIAQTDKTVTFEGKKDLLKPMTRLLKAVSLILPLTRQFAYAR